MMHKKKHKKTGPTCSIGFTVVAHLKQHSTYSSLGTPFLHSELLYYVQNIIGAVVIRIVC